MPNLNGKTLLITGATSGIGFEAAVALAAMGGRIVMVGRDPRKTTEKVAEAKHRSSSNQIESLLCDFSSQAQIRKLAADFRATHQRLDVLINNAGTVFPDRRLTEDGLESTFAVNHLAYFLLTHLLLDLIERSAPARVVNVASKAHYSGSMNFEDLGFARGFGTFKAYARSKLGNVLFTRELARRLAGKGVTANVLHPGVVATGIWSHGAPTYARFLNPLLNLYAKLAMVTPAKGAETIVYLASSPEVEGKSGLYFDDQREKVPGALALDDQLAAQLWAESARLVKLPGANGQP